ncbi:hypothetical protein BHM03_00059509 [Ensete ventricosum]|nr:hypothetical protein BHM03_00059509 [Ensete ventricosum]
MLAQRSSMVLIALKISTIVDGTYNIKDFNGGYYRGMGKAIAGILQVIIPYIPHLAQQSSSLPQAASLP